MTKTKKRKVKDNKDNENNIDNDNVNNDNIDYSENINMIKNGLFSLMLRFGHVIDYNNINVRFNEIKERLNTYNIKYIFEILPISFEFLLILFGNIYVKLWLGLNLSANIYNIYQLINSKRDNDIKDDIILYYFGLFFMLMCSMLVSIIFNGFYSLFSLNSCIVILALFRSYNLIKRL